MPQPTKIPRPFADSGDKNSIPDSTGNIGFASWQEGFPQITSEPFANGGVAPKRADFNGIFNALSLATVWQQQGGVYAYDATTDYEVGNVVEYSGDIYQCLVANGPGSTVKAPTDTTAWDKIATSAFVNTFWQNNVSALVSGTETNTSAPTETTTNIASFTLTKGTWLVEYTCQFAKNANGGRVLFLATSPTGNQIDRFNAERKAPISNAIVNSHVTTLVNCTAASATYYVNAYQDSGSTLAITEIGYKYMKVRAL